MRVYTDGNNKFLSVTTLVGGLYPFDYASYEKWAYKNGYDPEWIGERSTTLGERYHAYFENRYHGIDEWADVVDGEQDRKYQEARDEFFNNGWEILESEVRVVNYDLWYAGRFDMVMRNNDLGVEKALGDIKTWGAWRGRPVDKIYPDKLKKLTTQLNMYRRAIGERLPMYGIVPSCDGSLRVMEIAVDETWLDTVSAIRERLMDDIDRGKVTVEMVQLSLENIEEDGDE